MSYSFDLVCVLFLAALRGIIVHFEPLITAVAV